MNTERLYYHDAYLTSFSARVLESTDEGRRVYLNTTALYPASGGQPSDYGTLNDIPVVEVIDEDDRVAHVLERPLGGAEVQGRVQWDRRFDHMQQHTAQHLLSAICADELGYETLSVHFGPDYATIDLATEALTPSELRRLSDRSNALVAENRDVTVTFEESQLAEGLRKKSERTGILRVVTIDRLDRSACGGTHVRRTGEIGVILLRGQERMKQNCTRITFLAGHRAVSAAATDYQTLTGIARILGCAVGDAADLVKAQAEQLRTTLQQLKKADEELARFRAAEWYAKLAPDANGVRWLVERHVGPADATRALALAFTEQSKSVFVALGTEGPTLLVASSADSALDAGAWLKLAVSAVGGKGGGSPRLAQGRLPSSEALEHVASQLPSYERSR